MTKLKFDFQLIKPSKKIITFNEIIFSYYLRKRLQPHNRNEDNFSSPCRYIIANI